MRFDRKKSAIIIVDAQNDFCPGGALAVKDGDAIVGPCNKSMALFDIVVLTQDWHPKGHVSFASSWPGQEPFSQVEASGLAQTLWPDHCIAGSKGADFRPGLETERASLIVRKGRAKGIDSYSAFLENDRSTRTGLEGYLRDLGVESVFLAGLATDYCVLYTGLDAIAAGFRLVVLSDAVRAVDFPAGSGAQALERLAGLGSTIVASTELERE